MSSSSFSSFSISRVRESESTPVRGGEDRQVGSGPAGDSETVLQHIVSLSQSVSAPVGASQLLSDLIVLKYRVNIIPHLRPGQSSTAVLKSSPQFFLSAPVLLYEPEGEAVWTIKIRFTEITFLKSTTLYKLPSHIIQTLWYDAI